MANVVTEEITVRLTRVELALRIESLDSHEYDWHLGDVLPHKDGQDLILGDMEPDPSGRTTRPARQRDASNGVATCRRFADRVGDDSTTVRPE